MRFTPLLLAALLLVAFAEPLAAQDPEFPTDCTEATSVGNVFIGHDCGEWASILISGRIIIRKPWSRANRANRGVRLRLRREGDGAPAAEPADPLDGDQQDNPSPASDTPITKYGIDVSGGSNPTDLDCDDFTFQEDAQDLFDAQGWSATVDPNGLDESGRGDGVPCEHLPHRS